MLYYPFQARRDFPSYHQPPKIWDVGGRECGEAGLPLTPSRDRALLSLFGQHRPWSKESCGLSLRELLHPACHPFLVVFLVFLYVCSPSLMENAGSLCLPSAPDRSGLWQDSDTSVCVGSRQDSCILLICKAVACLLIHFCAHNGARPPPKAFPNCCTTCQEMENFKDFLCCMPYWHFPWGSAARMGC